MAVPSHYKDRTDTMSHWCMKLWQVGVWSQNWESVKGCKVVYKYHWTDGLKDRRSENNRQQLWRK